MGGYHPSLVGDGRLVHSPPPLAGDQDESVTIFFNVTDKVLVANKECLFYSWLGDFILTNHVLNVMLRSARKQKRLIGFSAKNQHLLNY